ncbi:MAG: VanZ family protein [Gemmatimonadota bacterium]
MLRSFAPALAWAFVIWLIGGITDVPSVPGGLGLDKLAHFTMFAILGWLFARGWSEAGLRRGALLPIVFVMLLGAADEVRQASLATRSADPADWVADVAGGAVGYASGLRRGRGQRMNEERDE